MELTQDTMFEVTPIDFAYKQIERHIESLILTGKLKPGSRLETTEKLAKKFKVTKNTIQKSLVSLTRRGLLTRSQKRGTLVSQSARCQTRGVVFGMDDLMNPNHAFWSALFKELEKEGGKAGWNCKPYLGFGDSRFDRILRELDADIAEGKLKAIVGLSGSGPLNNWLEKTCQVPWTTIPMSAEFDNRGFTLTGINYLLELGRRNITIMSNGYDSIISESIDSMKGQIPPGCKFDITEAAVGRTAGYEFTKKLFTQRRTKPDTLFMFDDRACEGAVKALLELGLRIPDDVAILSWAAKNVEIFSPVPISTIEFNPKEPALAIIADLMNQIEGQPRKRVSIKLELFPRNSCGENETAVKNARLIVKA